MAAHSEPCHAVGVNFLPLVVESLGGWDNEAAATIQWIGCLLSHYHSIPPDESTQHLFQRLAIALS